VAPALLGSKVELLAPAALFPVALLAPTVPAPGVPKLTLGVVTNGWLMLAGVATTPEAFTAGVTTPLLWMGWLAAGFTGLPVAAGLLLVALPGTMVGVPVLAAGLIALPVDVAGVVPLVAGALVPFGFTTTTP